jgi:hypothetical protein
MRRKNNAKAETCRKKFLRFFPEGFQDSKYEHWERDYKFRAHEMWKELLNRPLYEILLQEKNFNEIAKRAINIEAKTNFLFSFEKMALRDAVATPQGAQIFAEGLANFLWSKKQITQRYLEWAQAISKLPRKQTRVLTWPILSVFGFIAVPKKYIFFKPMVTRIAATKYGFELNYRPPFCVETLESLLEFVDTLKRELADMHPRDMIDIQSFIWVQGSSEYF